jgi:enterochelin esterase family protein
MYPAAQRMFSSRFPALGFVLALAVGVGCTPGATETPPPSSGSTGSSGGTSGTAPDRATGGSSGATASGGSGGTSSSGGTGPSGSDTGDSGGGAPAGSGGGSGDPMAPDAGAASETGTPSAPAGTVADPGSEGDGNVTMTGPYDYPPEATLQPGVTAGKLIDVPVVGKIFAGRTVQVYVPNGYVDKTPAPFIVLQDGPSYVTRFKLPTVLDNMIAKKQLPLMLAIFVPNGGAAKRSVEYDTLSDAYVRFVLEEILPAVEAMAPVKLTTDPEGRAAGGHSSGGIAAFSMGWYQPDQFRRILSNSGSFVSIRGGDKYPEVVKSMPKKPLRVYMSVGTKDNESPRWQRGNENMAAALKAQGYHYRFMLQMDGTHAQTFPAANLPEALLWLWRGYPIAGK